MRNWCNGTNFYNGQIQMKLRSDLHLTFVRPRHALPSTLVRDILMRHGILVVDMLTNGQIDLSLS